MIWKTFLLLTTITFILAACASEGSSPSGPTSVPFPTVTPGGVLSGVLTTPEGGVSGSVVNPATLAARANQPTPTADTSACPPLSDAELVDRAPFSESEIVNTLVNYLSNGGDVTTIEDVLRNDWNLLGAEGFVRVDTDLTGEGIPEVMISHFDPEGRGTFLILGCANQRYVVRYQDTSDGNSTPQIIEISDLNQNGIADLMYVNATCNADEPDDCQYDTRLIAWQPSLGRFTSLLGSSIVYSNWPERLDVDNDDITELILYLDDRGDSTTGPRRTGSSIYDWNGSVYVLSIWQADPPVFRIQYIHQADSYFLNNQMESAITLYEQALQNDELRAWRGDEDDVLDAYSLYRLLLAGAASGDQTLPEIIRSVNENFPEGEPVYAQMAQIFWDAFSTTGDLRVACQGVQALIVQRPEAVDLMNRYGELNPTYTAQQMCPF